MRLSEYHGDFVHSLYEACLSSETAPFEALGRELIRGLEAVAVSIWTEHPGYLEHCPGWFTSRL